MYNYCRNAVFRCRRQITGSIDLLIIVIEPGYDCPFLIIRAPSVIRIILSAFLSHENDQIRVLICCSTVFDKVKLCMLRGDRLSFLILSIFCTVVILKVIPDDILRTGISHRHCRRRLKLSSRHPVKCAKRYFIILKYKTVTDLRCCR